MIYVRVRLRLNSLCENFFGELWEGGGGDCGGLKVAGHHTIQNFQLKLFFFLSFIMSAKPKINLNIFNKGIRKVYSLNVPVIK
jgi:hypothetical protein